MLLIAENIRNLFALITIYKRNEIFPYVILYCVNAKAVFEQVRECACFRTIPTGINFLVHIADIAQCCVRALRMKFMEIINLFSNLLRYITTTFLVTN